MSEAVMKEPELLVHRDSSPSTHDHADEKAVGTSADLEVFKVAEGAVDFRTVGWKRAAVIFLKSMSLAMILSSADFSADLKSRPAFQSPCRDASCAK